MKKTKLVVAVIAVLNSTCSGSELVESIDQEQRFLPGEAAAAVKREAPLRLRNVTHAAYVVQDGESATVYILRNVKGEWIEQPASPHYVINCGTLILRKALEDSAEDSEQGDEQKGPIVDLVVPDEDVIQGHLIQLLRDAAVLEISST